MTKGNKSKDQAALFSPPRERMGMLPLLKWPGGKRGILKSILPLVPESFNRYYEPFVGGGALFFALQPRTAVLADTNAELINCYCQIRDNPDDVIEELSCLKNTKEDYYKVRDSEPTTEIERAARFVYLTTLSFNGIYRVNLEGIFNVPYGYKTHLKPCDPDRIYATSRALAHTQLRTGDFEATVVDASVGDLVYFDPPYTVSHNQNGFVKYNDKIFSWNDQERLARCARSLAQRGCKVVISNADHDVIRDLYLGFHFIQVERYSVIAASRSFRRGITEVVISNNNERVGK